MLLLELFDGIPLERRLPQTMFGLTDRLHPDRQGGKALLHHMGYVHCDLKPNNILVDAGGQAKVIDLGQTCKIGTAKSRIRARPTTSPPSR